MPDYGDILKFLAGNPPQSGAERQLHASLLELLASCLRDDRDVVAAALHHAGEGASHEAGERARCN